jgi:hypothetical protein
MFIQVNRYLTFRKLIPERRMEFPEQGASLHSLLAALVEEIGEPFQVGVFDEVRGGRYPGSGESGSSYPAPGQPDRPPTDREVTVPTTCGLAGVLQYTR